MGWLTCSCNLRLIYFKGKYHLFYQSNPYGAVWDAPHWGHATSTNLVNWVDEPVALAPDHEYDKDGVFSGSAIIYNDKLYLIYTGHAVQDDGTVIQNQNIAYSEDGIKYVKYAGNPVIDSSDLPAGELMSDFRDPKIVKHGDKYFVVIATSRQGKQGEILMYESTDMLKWRFKSIVLTEYPELGIIAECPDLFSVDGRDVLLFSAIHGENLPNTVSAAIGSMNWESGKFSVSRIQRVDCNDDLYAPQTFEHQGSRTMIAWLRSSDNGNFLADEGQNWNGQMSSPRWLRVNDNDELIQYPVIPAGITKDVVLTNSISVEPALSFSIVAGLAEEESLALTTDEDEKIELLQGAKNLVIKVQSKNNKHQVTMPTKPGLQLQIVLDRSSLEVFSEKEYVTSVVYFFNHAVDKLSGPEGTKITMRNYS